MNETEELRAELTRLGVEWVNRDSSNDYKTVWHYGRTSYLFIECIFDSDITILKVRKPTVAQAIAAMVGPKVCHMSYNELSNTSICLACGWRMDGKPNYCPNCGRRCVW